MKKLLRPLHRQRRARRNTQQILNGEEIATLFKVSVKELEDTLRARKMAYHKDSQGQIWASIDAEAASGDTTDARPSDEGNG